MFTFLGDVWWKSLNVDLWVFSETKDMADLAVICGHIPISNVSLISRNGFTDFKAGLRSVKERISVSIWKMTFDWPTFLQ